MRGAPWSGGLKKKFQIAGHLKKDCPNLTEERRKELQDLYYMKVERKGQGTGRKKNKRSAEEALGENADENESGSKPKRPPLPELPRFKKPLKDKTGTTLMYVLKCIALIKRRLQFQVECLIRNSDTPKHSSFETSKF